MAIVDAIKKGANREVKPPKDVKTRLEQAQGRMKKDAPIRNECFEMWRGNQYVYRATNGYLAYQSTSLAGGPGEKPRHRVRLTHNYLRDAVEREVSVTTQRVPSYEINASTTDPEDVAAARIAQKIAVYGYEAFGIKRAIESAVTYAIVGDEGFLLPFFDTTIGDPIDEGLGTGDVRIKVLGANQVGWQPGVRFEESRWHVYEESLPISEVKSMRDYMGGELSADTQERDILGKRSQQGATNLVKVTTYLERPGPANPQGRRIVMANGKVILPPEPYPLYDPARKHYVDEPILQKISYTVDPDNDRDLGLVRECLDAQRQINDAYNKITMWKNLALNPQILAPNGSMIQKYTDEPGAVLQYNPIAGNKPEFRQVPQIPRELFELIDRNEAFIRSVFAMSDISGSNESGRAVQSIIDYDGSRRARFTSNLARVHANLMRHCLYLVQRFYTEPRTLSIKGSHGPENLDDFLGANLRGQVDVTVLPGSIEATTRAQQEQRIMQYVGMQLITMEEARAALFAGSAEAILADYQLDESRQNYEIQQFRQGTFLQMPMRFDSSFAVTGIDAEDPLLKAAMMQQSYNASHGKPSEPSKVPGWMPRRFDNHDIHIKVLTNWMKTPDFAMQDAEVQESAELHLAGHEKLRAEKVQQEASLQQSMAEANGAMNAAKPQVPQPPGEQAPPGA